MDNNVKNVSVSFKEKYGVVQIKEYTNFMGVYNTRQEVEEIFEKGFYYNVTSLGSDYSIFIRGSNVLDVQVEYKTNTRLK